MAYRLFVCIALLMAASVGCARADDAAEIRTRLETWARDFNDGNVEATCGLFSKSVLSDVSGQGEADYETRCKAITRVLQDTSRKFRYTPDIKEVIVEGDLAVVRLQWTLTISPGGETSTETGLDVFRKEPDGVWRIIRFMAFDNE